jgi:hypothetical protein
MSTPLGRGRLDDDERTPMRQPRGTGFKTSYLLSPPVNVFRPRFL